MRGRAMKSRCIEAKPTSHADISSAGILKKTRTLALLVILACMTFAWIEPRPAQAQPQGCCLCSSGPKCDNANANGCAAQMMNDPTCVFILGGGCQAESCIGGTQTPTLTATHTRT